MAKAVRVMMTGWTHDLASEPPSVANQCADRGWPFGYLSRSNGDDPMFHFNPGLAFHEGKAVYVGRYSNYLFGRPLTWPEVRSDVLVGELDLETMTLSHLRDMRYPKVKPSDTCEDCRLTSTSMGLFLSGASVIPSDQIYVPQQVLVRLDQDYNPVETLRPIFGGNIPRQDHPRRACEKNWVWFESEEGVLSCVYHHNPQTVFNYDPLNNAVRVFTTGSIPPWEHGELRGGTQPVCWQDEWLVIAHCCAQCSRAPYHPKIGHLKRYVAVAVRFHPKPPYQITAYTQPIILGSIRSDSGVVHQPAVFPGGLMVQGDIATLVMGVNDRASAWVKINLNDLQWNRP